MRREERRVKINERSKQMERESIKNLCFSMKILWYFYLLRKTENIVFS